MSVNIAEIWNSITQFKRAILNLKEMNPILKALLKFCTTKNLFK